MEKIQIGICQMTVQADKALNLAKAEKMIHEAAQQGSSIIVLPEMFNSPYDIKLLSVYAEKEDEESTRFLSRMAREHQVILVGGSIPERDASGEIYNSCFVYGSDGSKLARYRKTHLFDVDIPGQISFKESDILYPGNEITMVDTGLLRMAVLICYDIRFPELARIAMLNGAELLVVPAAFNTTTGPAHWELLMRARAVDNQVFVAAASPARNPNASYPCWGHSMVVDPWGTIIAKCEEEENIILCTLDPLKLKQVRKQIPVLEQRRTDLYEIRLKS